MRTRPCAHTPVQMRVCEYVCVYVRASVGVRLSTHTRTRTGTRTRRRMRTRTRTYTKLENVPYLLVGEEKLG